MRMPPAVLLFAIIDRTKLDPLRPSQGGTFAGVISYLNTFPDQLSTEIGHIVVLPAWQRTFLNTNAVGLMLKHALELPEDGGWGFRRVQWQANEQNGPSVGAAKRLGFKFEGIIRWQRILMIETKAGVRSEREDVLKEFPSQHTALLAVGWDDWVKEGRERIEAMMIRK